MISRLLAAMFYPNIDQKPARPWMAEGTVHSCYWVHIRVCSQITMLGNVKTMTIKDLCVSFVKKGDVGSSTVGDG